MEQLHSRLVVHLEPDDGGVVCVAADDSPHDAFCVVQEGGVREVGLLPGTPGDRLVGRPVGGDLGMTLLQPRWHRIGGCAEYDSDAASVRAVEDGL